MASKSTSLFTHRERAAAGRRLPQRLGQAALRALAAALPLAFSGTAGAQSPAVVFEARDRAAAGPAAPAALVDRKSLAAPVAGIDRVIIRSFRFPGARLIGADRLAAEVAVFVGRDLAPAELHRAAQQVAQLYLRDGSMARVRVATVAVAEGVAEIEVHELRIGRVRVDMPAITRIAPDLVERFVTAGLAAGQPVPLARLEDGIALLNSEPGIAAAIALDPGTGPDDVNITVRVVDRPVLSGRMILDNHGLREIGQDRLGLSLQASNAFGLTERFALDIKKSAGSESATPSFGFALGDAGTRAAIEATQARYEARRGGAALEFQGEFARWKASLLQRWQHAAGVALNADYSLQRIAYRDDSMFGELHRRVIHGAGINVASVARSNGAITRVGLEIERGVADLSANAADLAADAGSARIDGGYWRLRWRLGRELALGPGTLALRANGQWADRNLDPTRQFALGGAAEVRAYPTAEALGDGGWISTAEWRQPLAADLSGRLFADTGSIRRNARPWVDQRNRYELSGLGAGLTWQLPENFRCTADLARQWGGNPGRNADGTDSDGRQARWRLWLALSRDF